MIIFYARCSTAAQNEARQLGDAHACHAEKISIDKASGKNRDRPQLEAMISFARAGDKVICSDISRIARNTRDLLTIIAVSYTQLDVYKRQSLYRFPSIPILARAACNSCVVMGKCTVVPTSIPIKGYRACLLYTSGTP